jgi:hypothetical protein
VDQTWDRYRLQKAHNQVLVLNCHRTSNGAIPITNAIDTSGTVHPVQRAESGADFSDLEVPNGSACQCFTDSLASGIPTKVTFTFQIPQELTELTALDIGYWWYEDDSALGVSKRTALANIGAITAPNSQ